MLPGWEPEPRPHLGPQVCTLDHQGGHGRQEASSGPGFSPLAELGWGQAPGHLVGAPGDSTGREEARGRLGHPGRRVGTRVLSRDALEAEKLEKRSVGHAVPAPVFTNIHPIMDVVVTSLQAAAHLVCPTGPRAYAERHLGPWAQGTGWDHSKHVAQACKWSFLHPPQKKYKRESPTSWLSVIRRAGNALLLSQPQSISFVGLAPPPTRRICCLLDPRKWWGRETSQNTEGKYQAVSMRLNLIIRQFHRKFNFLSSSCFSHLMWADSGET